MLSVANPPGRSASVLGAIVGAVESVCDVGLPVVDTVALDNQVAAVALVVAEATTNVGAEVVAEPKRGAAVVVGGPKSGAATVVLLIVVTS